MWRVDRQGGGWSAPALLPEALRLGPDGHTLYLASPHIVAGAPPTQAWNDGKDNIWSVDLAPLLEGARP